MRYMSHPIRHGLAGIGWLACLASLAGGLPAAATTLKPVDFDDLVARSARIVQGTVTDLRSMSVGTDLAHDGEAVATRAPRSPSDTSPKARSDAAPQAVGTEGGRRIVTEVTLEVEDTLAGKAGGSLSFRVAGGRDGERRLVVFGQPRFEIGHRYLLFLRPGFEASADPLVGARQGVFEIVEGPDGEEVVLDGDGHFVVGIENGRVLRRLNPDRVEGAVPRLAPGPTPDPGVEVESTVSPEMARFWLSEEPAMTPAELTAAVHTLREDS